MTLQNLKQLFVDKDCYKIYIKALSPNDNSKNQVYFGSSFEILNILPISKITTEGAGEWKRERFKASINFRWLTDEGNSYPAPNAQLILYPKYPEVRFSGFLSQCEKPPSELMNQRLANRLFFFSVSKSGVVFAYVADPSSMIASEFNGLSLETRHGVFKTIELPLLANNKSKLVAELARIHRLGWIHSKRLDRNGQILPCEAPNCGGYTLEAELGITPNGYSDPDFLGWEIKQFGVTKFEKMEAAIITLMTPEPTNGFYVEKGVEAFMRKYGYADKKNRVDRINFGGIHKFDKRLSTTGLRLGLIGFDQESNKIRSADGRIALLDEQENEAASWSFSSMLMHWNRKHNQACYVPSLSEKEPIRKYKYSNTVILGTGTDFQLFLSQMQLGHVYYDPAIKMENASQKPTIKRRSQFRMKSMYLPNLYREHEVLDITAYSD